MTAGTRHVIGVEEERRGRAEAVVTERVAAGKDVRGVEKIQTDGAHLVLFPMQRCHSWKVA